MSQYLTIKGFNFSILTAATFHLQHTEAATGGVLKQNLFLEFRKFHRKTPVPESLF